MKKYILLCFSFGTCLFLYGQNVGIGTSNPGRAKFEVYGTAAGGATSAMFGSDGTGISLQRNWPTIGFNQYHGTPGVSKYMANGFAAAQYLDPNNGGLYFDLYTNGTANAQVSAPQRMLSLFQNGHIGMGLGNSCIGINTSSPVYPLEIRQVNVSDRERGILLVNPRRSFDNWEIVTSRSFANNISYLYFNFNGNNRVIFNPNDGSILNISDARLKSNIQNLNSTLAKVMQLRPVEYEMKYSNPDHIKSIGFIAQEVKELFPNLVALAGTNENTVDSIADLHTMNYAGFSVLAIKAIQEQQAIIEKQKKQMEELQNDMQLVLNRLAALERR